MQLHGLEFQNHAFPPTPPSPRVPLRLHRARFRAVRLAPPSPAITMIIYRDLISHDELFSDIYKIREIADGLCLEVEGKVSGAPRAGRLAACLPGRPSRAGLGWAPRGGRWNSCNPRCQIGRASCRERV